MRPSGSGSERLIAIAPCGRAAPRPPKGGGCGAAADPRRWPSIRRPPPRLPRAIDRPVGLHSSHLLLRRLVLLRQERAVKLVGLHQLGVAADRADGAAS